MTRNTVATRRALIAAGTALVTAAVVVALVAAVFLLTGWRLFVVATPSMATTAPVGSLVLTAPQPDYRVGDVITFTVDGRTVTHRLHADDDGVIVTKGDLNGSPDAWRITTADVVGKVVGIVPTAGWMLRGLPWLVVGVALVEALIRTLGLHGRWRANARLLGWSVALAAVSLWLRPWVGVQMLDFRAADSGEGVLMHLVNTGIFPVRAAGTTFTAGQDVVVLANERLASGAYGLTPEADVGIVGRVVIVLVCLVPLLLALLRIRTVDQVVIVGPAALRSTRRSEPPMAFRAARRGLIAVCVVVPVVLVTLLGVGGTGAAFAAQVSGTGSVATNAAFTCRAAISASGPGTIHGAFAMDAGRAAGGNEPNLVAGAPNGIWAAQTVVSDSSSCGRDRARASVAFDGEAQCLYVPGQLENPRTFSAEAWFRTSTASNGPIVGFGDEPQSATDRATDRAVSLDAAGRVVFGVTPGRAETISSTRSVADGRWHHVVATLSGEGMVLYLDGERVARNSAVTQARAVTGFWKFGCGARGATSATANGPSHFRGQMQYAAIHTVALSADEVRAHYRAGR